MGAFFGALVHGILRHRDYIDGKQLARAAAFSGQDAEQWAAAFRRCSDLLTGHDSSQGRNRAAPGPEELLQDVGVLATWVRGLRDRQKRRAISQPEPVDDVAG